jgi:hypothetical protein
MTVAGCRPDGSGYVRDHRYHQNEQDSSRFRAAMLGRKPVDVVRRRPGNRDCPLARLGLDAVGLFEDLLENAGIVVVPLDDEMTRAAFGCRGAQASYRLKRENR